ASAVWLFPPVSALLAPTNEALPRLGIFTLLALLISILNDARYRVARALQQERDRLQVTLASIGDAVIATDAQGMITFLNPVAEALTGWSAAEAHGRPLPDVFPIVHEQTHHPVANPVATVLQEGRIIGLANHTVLMARDGRAVPIDDSGAPIR